MTKTRIERDSMGELAVPIDAFYGAQTQRAVLNFPISGQRMPLAFIRALVLAKSAAARANIQLEQIKPEIGEAIIKACNELLDDSELIRHFPLDIFQTGSGTSTNMNANEVIAYIASKHLGTPLSANDAVNCGQSSNDIIPSSIHISAALQVTHELLPAFKYLLAILAEKSRQVKPYIKTGRTHLMDAMPVRLSQVLDGWSAQINANIRHLEALLPSLLQLAQGGTAVGTGINTHPQFSQIFCSQLNQFTGLSFFPGENCFALIGSQDTAVALSGMLKTSAVSLMKIANDLRWMNSGPLAGLGEIALPALQPGSSIMPGKVNPVIPEAVAMVCAQVIGNDLHAL